MKKTINLTIKLDMFQLTDFESWLRHNYDVVDLKVVPDTENLYNNDAHFKKLVKNVKIAQKIRDNYINKKNE